ncbi:MAG: M56 family metallopeptidase [Actinobacteria bacterium]|nr:M56 family metallopeptidase [Actinomycetota bacterium]
MPEARARRRVLAALIALLVVACLSAVIVTSPPVAAAAGALGGTTLAVFVIRAWRHGRLARAFTAASTPGAVDGVAVRWLPFDAAAAVAGLRRPNVFCHPSLRGALNADELRAVVLHERHHQLQRDPLRLVALDTVAPLVTLVPGGRRWLEDRRAAIEIAADAYALGRGTSRRDLIRALLTVGHGPSPDGAAGFAPAIDQRLRALVEVGTDEPGATDRHSRPVRLSLGVAVVVAVCVVGVAHHLVAAGTTIGCVWSGC